ncbi:uncharacterized protein LOC121704923 [Alosa sapidissima]|uniref:uncharacterized protein LOC121704923 n=1 Tax=Alosa sapidissima TaxID=34773 RepID=UPI001C088100|nr:uncharacterized protein LOC121704923 [Alosa sapidissima]
MTTVTWDEVFGADSYRAVAVDGNGTALSCTSTSTSCQITMLQCGEVYLVSVTAISYACESTSNYTASFQTVPCPPVALSPYHECASNVIVFSWNATNITNYYVATSLDANGQVVTCQTTQTSCFFTSTSCGQRYKFAVSAVSGACNSGPSKPIYQSTAPCLPVNVQTSSDCDSDVLISTWDSAAGALSYTVEARGNRNDTYTCSSHTNSCAMDAVSCGEVLSIWITASHDECTTESVLGEVAETVPCTPQNFTLVESCKVDSVSLDWEASNGAIFYIGMAVHADGSQHSCAAMDTHCDIQGLRCGTTYDTYVIATNIKCNSSETQHATATTAPCPPTSVLAIRDCAANHAVVMWESHLSGGTYTAVVQDGEGRRLNCSDTGNHCTTPVLACGQNYSVTVQHFDGTCNSYPSTPIYMESASLDCDAEVALVSWDPQGALGVTYLVNASGSEGVVSMCSSTSSNCSLSGLPCGQKYNVTVSASAHGCASAPSDLYPLTQASCTSTLTQVDILCRSDSALVSWFGSVAGEYTATAEDGQGRRLNCTSTNTSCEVSGLRCGQLYTFSVAATGSQCQSLPSNTMQKYSVPCLPESVQSSLHCENGSASVSWSPSSGAVFYIATLERPDGQQSLCNTSGSSCDFSGLPCGQTYAVTVAAEGQSCNSSQSTGPPIRTAPCVPENVTANISCSSNIATVTWDSSHGAVAYTVVANGNGHSATCNSTTPTCDLSTLNCGQNYTITVSAEHSNCSSGNSSPVEIHTVPCVPSDVMASVHCMSNSTMTVQWTESAGGDTYTAMLEDSNGQSTSCQSLGSQCNVSGLHCGQIYHVSVMASDDQCSSAASTDIAVHSEPCAPTGIEAILDCQLGTATLSWQNSAGAVSYTAVAETASLGHNVTCDTNATNCELDALVCGAEYAVAVVAHGDTCYTSAQMPGYLITEPCTPLNLRVDYSQSVAQLHWNSTRGAVNFTAEAVTPQGLNASCSTNTTSCALSDMACGQVYNVTVTAQNQVCQDTSAVYQLMTEPCAPQNVQSSNDCETNTGTVSWEQSLGAVGYAVLLQGQNGHPASCVTTDTSCSMEGLVCGTVYSVGVTAIGSEYNSSMSSGPSLMTAPCLPGNVTVSVDCDQDMAAVRWSGSMGSDNHTVTALSADGLQASCFSEQDQCNITGLQCGQTYNLSITAANQACALTNDTGVTFQTRPCAPTSVSVDQSCGSLSATLSWAEQGGVQHYTGAATQGTSGHVQTCNSDNSSCVFPSLACGERYTFTVTAHGQLCPSNASSAVDIQTEPCQPVNVTARVACNNDTVTLDWDNTPGALSYIISISGHLGYVVDFNSTESQLEATLPCGQSYNATVTPRDDRCDGPQSALMQFKTGPCVPAHVDTFVQCEDHTGSVSWSSSDGAQMYTALATSSNGDTHQCVTNDTLCTWNDLQCGERYIVTVMATDANCSSLPSNSSTLYMAPCAPVNVTNTVDCSTGVVLVIWDHSHGAVSYTVSAQGSGGYASTCNTTGTSCQFSDLLCGMTYDITLSAQSVDQTCSSQLSSPISIDTVPCEPQNASAQLNCTTHGALVSWEAGDGSDNYLVQAVGDDGHQVGCNSSSSSCSLPSMHCGQSYNVTVTVLDGVCDSVHSEFTLQSAACAPGNIQTNLQCDQGTATVSWQQSSGDNLYLVVGEAASGHRATCNSSATSCDLQELQCGQTYNVSVYSMDSACSSMESSVTQVHTAPCSPTNVSGHLDCVTNAAWVSWQEARGAHGYTVIAVGEDRHNSSCTTTDSTTCSVPDLGCSGRYTFHVIATHHHCTSPPSPAIQMETAPCNLSSIVAFHECHADHIEVVWESSDIDHLYTATAEASDYTLLSCNSTSSSCNLTQVRCGMHYTIVVTASSDTCTSLRSPPYRISTAPCAPVNISAERLCESDGLFVSWSPSPVAQSYQLTATAGDGDVRSCNTSQSNCTLTDLHCGQAYSLALSASHENCSSQPSPPVTFSTVPCPPESLSLAVECGNSSAVLSWGASTGAVSYTGCAQAENSSMLYCHSSEESCLMEGLECGTTYNFTVQASDGQCNSSFSEPLTDGLVPCAPEGLQVHLRSMMDDRQVLRASWSAVDCPDAQYLLEISGSLLGDPQMLFEFSSYWTIRSFFEIPVPCSSTYNVAVKARSSAGMSPASAAVTGATAPCPPLTVKYTGSNVSAVVSWNASVFATEYSVYDVSGSVPVEICNTTDLSCTVNGVNSEGITVTASSNIGESNPVSVTHAEILQRRRRSLHSDLPAPELTVTKVGTDSVRVEWTPVPGASHYTLRVREPLTARPLRPEVMSVYGESSGVTNLKPATTYCFSVSAVMDSLASTLYSEPACATTSASI